MRFLSLLQLVWLGKPLLNRLNVCTLPAGQVFSCCAADIVANHRTCVGCHTSGTMSSIWSLVCLKPCGCAAQLSGSQFQTRLQIPPTECMEIDCCMQMICADVHKVNVWQHHVQCQAWTSVLRALALSTRSSVFSEVYEWEGFQCSYLSWLFFFLFFVILSLRITLEWFASTIYQTEVVCGNGGWGT